VNYWGAWVRQGMLKHRRGERGEGWGIFRVTKIGVGGALWRGGRKCEGEFSIENLNK
jgi:hypothetical protein